MIVSSVVWLDLDLNCLTLSCGFESSNLEEKNDRQQEQSIFAREVIYQRRPDLELFCLLILFCLHGHFRFNLVPATMQILRYIIIEALTNMW